MSNAHGFSFTAIDGAALPLSKFKGKAVLVVNTASLCGFTGQYEGLAAVYDKYKDRGLVIVGFPSNDFGDQEPGSSKEIADFCRTTYGIKFPMMAKTDIAAPKTHAFYKQLIAKSGTAPKEPELPTWSARKAVCGLQCRPKRNSWAGTRSKKRPTPCPASLSRFMWVR